MSQSEKPWMKIGLGIGFENFDNRVIEFTSPIVVLDPKLKDVVIDSVLGFLYSTTDKYFHSVFNSRWWEWIDIGMLSEEWKGDYFRLFSKQWKCSVIGPGEKEETIVSLDPITLEPEPGESSFFVRYFFKWVEYCMSLVDYKSALRINEGDFIGFIKELFYHSLVGTVGSSHLYEIFPDIRIISGGDDGNHEYSDVKVLDKVVNLINQWIVNHNLFYGSYEIERCKRGYDYCIRIYQWYGGRENGTLEPVNKLSDCGSGFRNFIKVIPKVLYSILTGQTIFVDLMFLESFDVFHRHVTIDLLINLFRSIPEDERGKIILFSYDIYESRFEKYKDVVQTIELPKDYPHVIL